MSHIPPSQHILANTIPRRAVLTLAVEGRQIPVELDSKAQGKAILDLLLAQHIVAITVPRKPLLITVQGLVVHIQPATLAAETIAAAEDAPVVVEGAAEVVAGVRLNMVVLGMEVAGVPVDGVAMTEHWAAQEDNS